MTKKAHPVAARDAMARKGTGGIKGSPPLVTWRCDAARHILLRVYLTPDGWVLDGSDFAVSVPEWIERTGGGDAYGFEDGTPQTLTAYREGRWAAFSPREVSGVQALLSLDFAKWEKSRFEVGCRCGHNLQLLSDVRDDCQTARSTRRSVLRRVSVERVT